MSAASTQPDAPRVGLDRFGAFWSGLCALHCVTFWGLAAWGVLDGHEDEDHGAAGHDEHGAWTERLELGMVAVAALIAVAAIGRGFARHGERRPLIFLGAALLTLGAARALEVGEVGEVALSVLGAAGLITAHLLNLSALRRAAACC